jgi:peptidoglycan/LPS O-acetylase OafA/YrhL
MASTLIVAMLFALSGINGIWPIALPRDIFSLMIVWWLGVLLAEIYVGRLNLKFLYFAPLSLLLFVLTAVSLLGHPAPDVLWGIAAAGLIAAGFAWEKSGRTLRILDLCKPLGDCSYTLYVIHAPILVFASGWLMSRSATGELPSSAWFMFSALLIVPVAYALHFVTERPFLHRREPRRAVFSAVAPVMPDGVSPAPA